MNTRTDSLKNRYALLLLLLIPVLLHLPALGGLLSPDPMSFTAAIGDIGRHHGGFPWIDPNVGYQGQALGKLSADQWLQGRIPWWNAYSGVGLPLAAEAQPGSFFLPFVLLMHFRSGGIWVELLLQIIAGACTFALLRKISLTTTAAFVGALLFELNGTFAWHGAPIASPIAFLPMLILGVEQLRTRIVENGDGGWLLIPLALAWSICAGFPEIAYINGLFAGVWVLARLADMERSQQIAFVAKLCLAVFFGILLALPLIIPFSEYVALAYIGGHEDAFAHLSPALPTLSLSMLPWLYGPIFFFNDPSNSIYSTWAGIGGFFPILQIFVALLGLFFARRRLYPFLLIWMGLCFAKTFDIRPVSDLINLIPMIKLAAFFRYSPASWEFAGAVLVAFTVDGMQRKVDVSPTRIVSMAVLICIALVCALWPAREAIEALMNTRHYKIFFSVATAWAAISMLGAVLLVLLRHRWRYAIRALAILLILDACLAFSLPLRSGVKKLVANAGGVKFLQQHLELHRTYTLGPLSPNYGAYFQIAQINYNYLPVSKDWVEYVHAHLNPQADPIIFLGDIGRTDHSTDAAGVLGQNVNAYEEVGVRYVIAPPGANPFARSTPATGHGDMPDKATALALADKQSATVRWLPAASKPRLVEHLAVFIGNYAATADGSLVVRLCDARGICAAGARALAESRDNTFFDIGLSQPLTLAGSPQAEAAVTATITHLHGSRPVALWLMPADRARQVSLNGKPAAFVPSITLGYREPADAGPVASVYDGADMTIYELPHPKAYFETTDGRCVLQPLSREALDASCQAPAELLRREAFYPGWSATVDGRPVALARSHEIFQGLALPAGRHRVAYSYRPTHAWLILAAFVAGVLGLLWGMWRELRRLRMTGLKAAAAPAP